MPATMLPFLLFLPLLTATVAATATYPVTQLLNVKDIIKETESEPTRLPEDLPLHENYPIHNTTTHTQWKLKLFHRDNLPLNFDPDHRCRFKERMERDLKRVSSLLRQLSNDSNEQVIKDGVKKEGGRQLPALLYIIY